MSRRWDILSASERTVIQRRRFADALALARRGVQVEHNLQEASDALTLLRHELLTSPAGHAEHRELEAQFDGIAARIRRAPQTPAEERLP